jgi:hypothetical protein
MDFTKKKKEPDKKTITLYLSNESLSILAKESKEKGVSRNKLVEQLILNINKDEN